MSSCLTLSRLHYALPDGRLLFSGLDLQIGAERVGLVGRNGVGKSTLLGLISGNLKPRSGSVTLAGRLGVLRQDVRPPPEETVADLFGAAENLCRLARADAGLATAEDLAEADWTLPARIEAALAGVGLDVDPAIRTAALSGGQRTRACLAALVFDAPDLLLLDEPTNHLDRDGRAAVMALIDSWRAGALIVSHDRELLERVDAIVELTPRGASRHGGGWSAYKAAKALEVTAAERRLADAEKRVAEAARNAQIAAERQSRKHRVAQSKAAGGGIPGIALGGRKEQGENTAGSGARLAERQRTEALATAAAARAPLEILQPMTVSLPPTGLDANKVVLRVEAVTAGYDRRHPVLTNLSLTVVGPERIAIGGPNGSGKTTLLSLIQGFLQPWAGSVDVRTTSAVLDQSARLLDGAQSIRDNFRRLNPDADENACRAALARFTFRADAALRNVATLSGGETLRAALACVLGGPRPPPLLILDEPTNHLDLASIEVVEAGLRAYDGALLVVSHDWTFLDAIGVTRQLMLAPPSSRP